MGIYTLTSVVPTHGSAGSEAVLVQGQGNPDTADDARKARIAPQRVESGIHPDEDHSKGSLLDAFFEPVKSLVVLAQVRIHGSDVVAAHKLFL
jgi:hypothetical protein